MATVGVARRASSARRKMSNSRSREREFTVIIEQDEEGYFVAEVPELRSCYTQARSMDELVERVRKVILLCLDAQRPPKPKLCFVGVQRVAV